jgi:hypothetical protein
MSKSIPVNNPSVSWFGSLLRPIHQLLESIEVCDPNLARSLCKMIPARCPFEREIKVFDRTLVRIPPLCKLNPFYDQIVGLRFKSLTYLADQCGEDITLYC